MNLTMKRTSCWWTGALVVLGLTTLGCAVGTSLTPVLDLANPLTRTAWGQLFKPDGEGPFPAVILMHGSEGVSGHNFDQYADYARRLAKQGYVAWVLDSFTPRGLANMAHWDERVSDARYDDALGAAAALRKLDFVDADRLAVIGWSDGGRAVLRIAQSAPPGFRAAIGVYPSCYGIGGRPRVPVQFHIAGNEDWPGPRECEARGFMRLGPPHQIHMYAGAHHGFDQVALGEHPRVSWRGTVAHNPDAARNTWESIRAFLAANLR